jgi:hypothetical protein
MPTDLELNQPSSWESFLNWIGNTGYGARNLLMGNPEGAMHNAADLLSGPVRALIPGDQANWELSTKEERPEASDLLTSWGMDKMEPGLAKTAVDIGGGILTDPLSLVPGTWLTKGAKAGYGATRALTHAVSPAADKAITELLAGGREMIGGLQPSAEVAADIAKGRHMRGSVALPQQAWAAKAFQGVAPDVQEKAYNIIQDIHTTPEGKSAFGVVPEQAFGDVPAQMALVDRRLAMAPWDDATKMAVRSEAQKIAKNMQEQYGQATELGAMYRPNVYTSESGRIIPHDDLVSQFMEENKQTGRALTEHDASLDEISRRLDTAQTKLDILNSMPEKVLPTTSGAIGRVETQEGKIASLQTAKDDVERLIKEMGEMPGFTGWAAKHGYGLGQLDKSLSPLDYVPRFMEPEEEMLAAKKGGISGTPGILKAREGMTSEEYAKYLNESGKKQITDLPKIFSSYGAQMDKATTQATVARSLLKRLAGGAEDVLDASPEVAAVAIKIPQTELSSFIATIASSVGKNVVIHNTEDSILAAKAASSGLQNIKGIRIGGFTSRTTGEIHVLNTGNNARSVRSAMHELTHSLFLDLPQADRYAVLEIISKNSTRKQLDKIYKTWGSALPFDPESGGTMSSALGEALAESGGALLYERPDFVMSLAKTEGEKSILSRMYAYISEKLAYLASKLMHLPANKARRSASLDQAQKLFSDASERIRNSAKHTLSPDAGALSATTETVTDFSGAMGAAEKTKWKAYFEKFPDLLQDPAYKSLKDTVYQDLRQTVGQIGDGSGADLLSVLSEGTRGTKPAHEMALTEEGVKGAVNKHIADLRTAADDAQKLGNSAQAGELLDSAGALETAINGLPPREGILKYIAYGNRYFKPFVTSGAFIPRIAFNVRNMLAGGSLHVLSTPGARAQTVPFLQRLIPDFMASVGDGLKQLGVDWLPESRFDIIQKIAADSGGSRAKMLADLTAADPQLARAFEHGILNNNFVSSEFMAMDAAKAGNWKKLKNLRDWPAAITRGVEQRMRFGVFNGLIEKEGLSPQAAAKATMDALFDYDISGTGNRAARDVIPFFQWSAKSIPQALKFALEKPMMMAGMGPALREGKDQPIYPYMQRDFTIPLGKGEDGKANYISNIGTPLEAPGLLVNPLDLAAGLVGGGQEAWHHLRENVGGMVSPPLKYLLNQWSGVDQQFGTPVGAYDKTPQLLQSMGMEPHSGLGRAYQSLASTGMIQPLATPLDLLGRVVAPDKTVGQKVSSLIVGAPVVGVDESRAIQQLIEQKLKENPDIKRFTTISAKGATDPEAMNLLKAYKDAVKASKTPVDTTHDVPLGGSVAADGSTVYLDKMMPKTLTMKNGTVVDVAKATRMHETGEVAAMNEQGKPYPAAHQQDATLIENTYLKSIGVDPKEYNAALKPYLDEIAKTAKKRTKLNIPQDLPLDLHPKHAAEGVKTKVQDTTMQQALLLLRTQIASDPSLPEPIRQQRLAVIANRLGD